MTQIREKGIFPVRFAVGHTSLATTHREVVCILTNSRLSEVLVQHSLQDFLSACRSRTVVPLFRRGNEQRRTINVLADAAQYYNLNTQEELMDFLGEGEFDDHCFYDTQRWADNPHPDKPVWVDSYHFFLKASVHPIGYFAFFKNPLRDIWVLKSFHPNRRPDAVECVEGKLVRLLQE